MRVMVMVKGTRNRGGRDARPEKLLNAMGSYNEELVKAGVMLDGEGLHPSSKGVRIQFSGDQRTVIDGPFAETKELIAGYWIWQVQSMDEAIEWVEALPESDRRGDRARAPAGVRARRLRRQRDAGGARAGRAPSQPARGAVVATEPGSDPSKGV